MSIKHTSNTHQIPTCTLFRHIHILLTLTISVGNKAIIDGYTTKPYTAPVRYVDCMPILSKLTTESH